MQNLAVGYKESRVKPGQFWQNGLRATPATQGNSDCGGQNNELIMPTTYGPTGTYPQQNRGQRVMSEFAPGERKRHLEEIGIFHDVAKALTSSLDLDAVLQTVMDNIAKFFRPDT